MCPGVCTERNRAPHCQGHGEGQGPVTGCSVGELGGKGLEELGEQGRG